MTVPTTRETPRPFLATLVAMLGGGAILGALFALLLAAV